MRDIIIPDGNEEEFQKVAEKLGYDEIIFLYEKPPKKKDGKTALLVENSKEVSKHQNKADYIIAECAEWAFNDKRVDMIFNMEQSDRKDFMHHRASGMNQVRAKQARDNDIKIAFNWSQLYDEEKRDIVLGRMKQNVKLCRKYDVKTVLASFAIDPYEMRSPQDLQAFGENTGMHPENAKQSLDWK